MALLTHLNWKSISTGLEHTGNVNYSNIKKKEYENLALRKFFNLTQNAHYNLASALESYHILVGALFTQKLSKAPL